MLKIDEGDPPTQHPNQAITTEESTAGSIYETFEEFDIQDEMLEDIGGANLDAVQSVVDKLDNMRRAKDHLGAEMEKDMQILKEFMIQQKDGLEAQVTRQKDKIEGLLLDAPFRRQFDKYGFVYGLSVLMIIPYLIGKYPRTHYLTISSALIVVQMIVRVFHNVPKKDGFFLTDFCYFSNIALMVFLLSDPKNETLFKMVYVQANGPLLISIYVFRTTLTIHRPDAITGVLIHVIPSLTTLLIRWQLIPEEQSLTEGQRQFCTLSEQSGLDYLFAMLGVPLIFYWTWLLCQCLLIFYLCHAYIKRTNQLTMYGLFWQKPWAVKIFEWAGTLSFFKMMGRGSGEGAGPLTFCLCHSIYQLATLLVGVLAYEFWFVAMPLSLLMIWSSFYFGATYYMDWFAAKYEAKLAKLTEIQKKVKAARQGQKKQN